MEPTVIPESTAVVDAIMKLEAGMGNTYHLQYAMYMGMIFLIGITCAAFIIYFVARGWANR